MKKIKLNVFLLFSLLMIVSTSWSYTAEEKQKVEQFLGQQFKQQTPKPARLWVKGQLKSTISKILNRTSKQLSYRYWRSQGKTIWLLDEIGKERNITTAVVVRNKQISEIKVVVYRESRGGEVQVPWFTEQFKGADSQSNWQHNIDSISGATLSVNAIKIQAELALYLNSLLPEQKQP